MGEEVYNSQSTIKILFDDSDQITLVGLAILFKFSIFLSIYNVNFILNVNKKYLP